MKIKPFTPQKYRRRILVQLWMLAAQFVLGMILNLVGSDTNGLSHALYVVALILHILTAFGLVEGAVYLGLKERSRLAWLAAATLGGALVAGILTTSTDQDVWSFLMACGFVIGAWLYGVMYVNADRQLRR